MVKVDLFKADKTMSTRVEEYVKCRILRKAIMKEYNDKISAIDTSVENLEKLRGSILEDKIEPQKAQFLIAREELITKRDEQIKKEATFEFTQGDKDFRKALKGLDMNSPVIAEQVIAWFNNYNLDITDSQLLADILLAIGGKEDFNKLVDTEGLDAVAVDNTRALSMLYWVAFRHMAQAGTIKPAQIPDIIKNNFGKVAKANKKKAKAEAKKTEKAENKENHSDNKVYVDWCAENNYEVNNDSWALYEKLVETMAK